eukprot:3488225-Rhodomonas_salina.1
MSGRESAITRERERERERERDREREQKRENESESESESERESVQRRDPLKISPSRRITAISSFAAR